jgi:DNA invertase Pin-like site-specific DNA recombinase
MLNKTHFFAEFGNGIRSERIKAGMERAKEQGKHVGRPVVDNNIIEQIKELLKAKKSDGEIMRTLNLSRNTVKKYKKMVQ